jgi:HD-GYP domain-containing protein (c-di-GMP phosphodiesterase class II)
VGKVGIPEAVLNKPGPLDAQEWEVMRAHPLLGVQMVAGDDLPAGARVFSVADAFDAMTSDRSYRKAIPFDRACQEIADGAGSGSTRRWSRPSPPSSPTCPACTRPCTTGLWTA